MTSLRQSHLKEQPNTAEFLQSLPSDESLNEPLVREKDPMSIRDVLLKMGLMPAEMKANPAVTVKE